MESSSSTASVALVYCYNWVNEQVISHLLILISFLGFFTDASSSSTQIIQNGSTSNNIASSSTLQIIEETTSSSSIEVVSRAGAPRKPPRKPISKGNGPKTNNAPA
ncbi:hypothetical protein POM88_046142 [Heracleum sosnowskyi]|uniref:Uncharacterized protein n=1 Tax=Heracleum sosnowskyi TaxID=360622 RepID=A0AAD8M5M8_9APIA|nr:hypothetical protein POM88_046140 [Heracleum sosnowskyi]KAK1361668.1 hypothetical protein POM88_046142 [Heracleum sosnowskyi]